MRRAVTMASRHLDGMVVEQLRSSGKGARRMEPLVGGLQEAEDYRTVSLRHLAGILDTSRASARRWLREAGIKPIAIGRGRNGAIRYRWNEVRAWLESRERVE
jgi:hypothetical protein